MMGYYLGVSHMVPRREIGAQGGFFSFLGSAIQRIAPIAAGVLGGVGGRVAGAIANVAHHPVISGAAAAATGAAVTTAITHHTGAAATAGVGGLQVHGHLHVGGRRKAGAAGMPGHRRRRMNVCNPRALRRAIRRAHGFEHFARKVISFPFHNRKAKRGVFKRTRKAK